MPQKNQVEHWLNKALEMEKRGHAHYLEAAGKAQDPLVAGLFNDLAKLELDHIETIKKIYRQLGETSCWEESSGHESGGRSLNDIFLNLAKTLAKPSTEILKAIDFGLRFESEALDFYRREIPNASCQAEKTFLDKLAGEENAHRQFLADLKLYFTDPAAWAERADKIHLDGV